MRIVTRPDFDGVVCAVIIQKMEEITEPVKWIEPGDIQSGDAEIKKGDIIANLPFDDRCSKWFDHHISNQRATSFPGDFKVAPSAAGIVYNYYKDGLKENYDELIEETDRIDAALLSMDEVQYPEKYPYMLLSMTITNRGAGDLDYWNLLVELLGKYNIYQILEIPEVKKRCDKVIKENSEYKEILKKHTNINGNVSVIDLRKFSTPPSGNRFMVYSMYPTTLVSMKIRFDEHDQNRVNLSVGHNIFNKKCKVNIGQMLSQYNGGGHFGAGGCSFPANKSTLYISEMLDILNKNQ
ncbi:MAG: exopolyphosphatase [Desulfobacteraceae bacterium 4572_19]|nr:MAG: exopolyphosphatase [Desulfobacteraceae bacterium 4572_19]